MAWRGGKVVASDGRANLPLCVYTSVRKLRRGVGERQGAAPGRNRMEKRRWCANTSRAAPAQAGRRWGQSSSAGANPCGGMFYAVDVRACTGNASTCIAPADERRLLL